MTRKLASVQYVHDVYSVEERDDSFGYDSVDALLARAQGTYEAA